MSDLPIQELDWLVTTPADRKTPAEFYSALFPKPSAEKQAERASALRDHQAAVQASYRLPDLMDGIVRREQLEAAYEARLREIEDRYSEQLSEITRDTDPQSGNERVAA